MTNWQTELTGPGRGYPISPWACLCFYDSLFGLVMCQNIRTRTLPQTKLYPVCILGGSWGLRHFPTRTKSCSLLEWSWRWDVDWRRHFPTHIKLYSNCILGWSCRWRRHSQTRTKLYFNGVLWWPWHCWRGHYPTRRKIYSIGINFDGVDVEYSWCKHFPTNMDGYTLLVKWYCAHLDIFRLTEGLCCTVLVNTVLTLTL